MPRISIIVPVYKVEPYIHRCVDSILGQTYPDFELILVDDGSPDNCGAICDAYAQKDSRIHVIHQENGGLSAARNAGIDWVFSNSDSQWLAFIDSDDWVHKDYLNLLLENVLTHDGDISACNYLATDTYRTDSAIETQKVFSLTPEEAYCGYYGYVMSAWRKLFRRELFADVRFPPGKIHEDCYVTHIPLFASRRVVVSTVRMYYYYANQDSITRKKWSQKRMQEVEAHEERLAWLERNNKERAARKELEECVVVSFIHTDLVAHLCLECREYYPFYKTLRAKLRTYLQKARKAGMFRYDRELRWHFILAYAPFSIWRMAKWLQSKMHEIQGIASERTDSI